MHQLRILGRLVSPEKICDWLRAPPDRIQSRYKNRPAISSVLILDTPRALVNLAALAFIVALSIYIVFTYVNNLDTDAGPYDSRNVVIVYFVSLWFCLALYQKANIFERIAQKVEVEKDLRTAYDSVKGAFTGNYQDPEDNPSSIPEMLRHRALSAPTKEAYPSSTRADKQYDTGNRPQGRPSNNTTESTLAELLEQTIDARRKCIEADERFLKALTDYKETIGNS